MLRIIVASSVIFSEAAASMKKREAKQAAEPRRRGNTDLVEELERVRAICSREGDVADKLKAIRDVKAMIGTEESLSRGTLYELDLKVFSELSELEETISSQLHTAGAQALAAPRSDAFLSLEALIAELESTHPSDEKVQLLAELAPSVSALPDPSERETLLGRVTALQGLQQGKKWKQGKAKKKPDARKDFGFSSQTHAKATAAAAVRSPAEAFPALPPRAVVKTNEIQQLQYLTGELKKSYNPKDTRAVSRLTDMLEAVLNLDESSERDALSESLTALLDQQTASKPVKRQVFTSSRSAPALASRGNSTPAAAAVFDHAADAKRRLDETETAEVEQLYGSSDALTVLQAVEDYVGLPSFAVKLFQLGKSKLAELKSSNPRDSSISGCDKLVQKWATDFRRRQLIP